MDKYIFYRKTYCEIGEVSGGSVHFGVVGICFGKEGTGDENGSEYD